MAKIRVFEFCENPAVDQPRCHRPKSFAKKLVDNNLARQINPLTIQLRKGVTVAGLGQMLATFRVTSTTIDHFAFSTFRYPVLNFDPSLAELPGMMYPQMLAPHSY